MVSRTTWVHVVGRWACRGHARPLRRLLRVENGQSNSGEVAPPRSDPEIERYISVLDGDDLTLVGHETGMWLDDVRHVLTSDQQTAQDSFPDIHSRVSKAKAVDVHDLSHALR